MLLHPNLASTIAVKLNRPQPHELVARRRDAGSPMCEENHTAHATICYAFFFRGKRSASTSAGGLNYATTRIPRPSGWRDGCPADCSLGAITCPAGDRIP